MSCCQTSQISTLQNLRHKAAMIIILDNTEVLCLLIIFRNKSSTIVLLSDLMGEMYNTYLNTHNIGISYFCYKTLMKTELSVKY